ncbi:PREDICTED: uncharacterized protein LOC18589849 [Theobroma cacao]|uniref:Uncharacterized protein LOC18589849 n=1 Tax=Theobroma cacao TaxID=3641 RepID=A0AB32URV4_THECC|nr:PREDICTED: uncharacterized protein LOC18589849 [Theobroma cacao]
MLSLHFCLPQSKHPSSFPPLSLSTPKHSTPTSQWIEHGGNYSNAKKRTKLSSSWIIPAVDNDSQQFEVDPEKAKEALQKLDQQLQTLSKKQVSTPKIRASDVKLARDKGVEDTPEISGSFLANLTAVLLILTIFYNVLFYAVIKPSIDGPDDQSGPQPSQPK